MQSYLKFPYALAIICAIVLLAVDAAGQTKMTRDASERPRPEADLLSIPAVPASEDEDEPEPEVISTSPVFPSKLGQIESVMLAAIDARLGIPYRMGSEGPNRYDCSGFVWSVFQTAGISFERSSARSFWTQFAPAKEEDKYKFGTLVFFNHVRHVGIVADENGFYHASSSRGVVYSPFSEYWTKRINGFRRVRLQPSTPSLTVAVAVAVAGR
jgi:peptidoglycan endopeptidase LytE